MAHKTFIVGRNPNVSQGEIPIQINDPSKKVSGNHCRITYDGANYYIEDLISSNGTFVNEQKIASKTLVNDNSQIKLGGSYNFSLENLNISSNNKFNSDESLDYSFKDKNSGKEINVSVSTDSKFFSFILPYLNYMDNGRFFKNPIIWVYTILAVLYLVVPFSLIIVSDVFNEYLTGKGAIALIIGWLIVAFNSWVCFQILWNRKKELRNIIQANDTYKAVPIFSHIIKTYGEVLGTTIGIVGTGASLLSILFYGMGRNIYSSSLSEILKFAFDSPFSGTILNEIIGTNVANVFLIFIFPIYGYLTVLFFKFISEMISVLASIANNTKKLN